MEEYISQITFVKKNSFSTSNYFEIKITHNLNLLKFIDDRFYDSMLNPKIIKMDDQTVLEFLDDFLRIISSWEEKYTASNMLDGAQWQLLIKFKDGHSKQYYGKDSYPDNFDYFEKIKYNIIEKAIGENL